MSGGKQQIRDMRYGRQGGRIVAFEDCPSLEGKPCDVCGRPMLGFQKGRHFSCDQTTVVGQVCICPPGCTDTQYGNGQRDCAKKCKVYTLLAGQPYKAPS